MKIIVGTSGRINEILQGIPNEEFISAAPFGDGKVLVVVKGKAELGAIGEVVEVDNPEHLKTIDQLRTVNIRIIEENEGFTSDLLEKDDQIQTLQDALSDALNAEEAAKKEAEDLKLSLKTLKTKFTKLKNKFLED